MSAEVHVGDVGTIFEATLYDETDTVLDVSSATTKQLLFSKPDGTAVHHTATFRTDGTDGKIRYIVVAGDLDQRGTWKVQGYVVLPSGSWHSSEYEFAVRPNLD